MAKFYISDTHFYHKNIIKYEKVRNHYESFEEMNEDMIKRWNDKVSKEDVVYIIGDLSFRGGDRLVSILERLNGEKVLILGNHDGLISTSIKERYFKDVSSTRFTKDILNGEEVRIHMSHFPLWDWDCHGHREGTIHLYGHIHDKLELRIPKENAYNVSSAIMDLSPSTLDDVILYNKKWIEGGSDVYE